MKIAAIADLKAHLSEYLNQVKVGGEVIVTDRGTPVARLVPVTHLSVAKNSFLKLQALGLIKLGSDKLPEDFWTTGRPEDPEGQVLRALLDEREAGR